LESTSPHHDRVVQAATDIRASNKSGKRRDQAHNTHFDGSKGGRSQLCPLAEGGLLFVVGGGGGGRERDDGAGIERLGDGEGPRVREATVSTLIKAETLSSRRELEQEVYWIDSIDLEQSRELEQQERAEARTS
jgi:hypothetical protein